MAGGYFPEGYFPEDYFPEGYFPEGAVTELTFVGPNISTVNLVVDVAMLARNFASRFSSPNSITYTLNGTPPAGVTLDANGVLSGTPTETGDFTGLSITADDGVDTVDSNTFTIRVSAASGISPGVSDGSISDGSISSGDISDGQVGA